MELITRAVIIGIAGSVMTLLIKKTNPEISIVLTMALCSLVLGLALGIYSAILEVLQLIEIGTGFSSAYTTPILKCVGIGITAKLGADLCRDSGQTALASSLEICGVVCALYVSLPLIRTLLRMIGELA